MTRLNKPSSHHRPMSERIALAITHWTGTARAFMLACLVVIAWLLLGPIFRFSDTWQLVINTATTIVTFLMVFLLQRAQNKESRAVHLKLNELVAAVEGASNRLVDVEALSEEELEVLHLHYRRLAEIAKHESDIRRSHSIDEAQTRHELKSRSRAAREPADAQ